MWVIKIGGSLQTSPHLGGWLKLSVHEGAGRVVIVPGGGNFAERVRATQVGLGIDDATAHRLALQATEDYAIILAGLEPRLVPAATETGIRKVLAAGQSPLWFAGEMVRQAPEVPQNWTVTSDSLALWLAQRLDAEVLVLVKSVPPPQYKNVEELTASGYVDEAFPAFLRGFRGKVACLGKDEIGAMAEWLRSGRLPKQKRLVIRDEALA
ncbi:MAG: hypothetical protein HYY48_11760 [Gammaproteobacteria bacterium]|nr:hypothetical protein [Gammaproteobacteria bacterium]